MQKLPGFVAMIALSIASALAQTKPAESTSKVKKVLLYNKIGGWVNNNGMAQVKAAFRISRLPRVLNWCNCPTTSKSTWIT